MIAVGNDACRTVSVGDAACVRVYVGNVMVFPDESPPPSYDETKIAVIELNENDEPTGNVEYFIASQTGAENSAAYIRANTDKTYYLRYGSNADYGAISNEMYMNCENINNVFLGDVGMVGRSAFLGCTGLTELFISDSVGSIMDTAFQSCTSLSSVRIPNAVMGAAVFQSCTSLTDIEFANDVTAIGERQFLMCTGITTITFPDTLENIYGYAFAGCESLSGEIEIPSSVSNIETGAFSGTNLTTITVRRPENSISGAPWGATSASIVWEGDQSRIAVVVLDNNYNNTSNVTYYTDISDAVTAIKDGSQSLYGLYVGTNSGATAIPSGAFANTTKLGRFVQGSVTDIGAGAFFRNTNLKYIDLSDGLLSVGDGAFNSTIMTELNVPNSVTTWGNGVIQLCAELQGFAIPSCVTELKSSEFYQCNSLENVTITENVTTIKQNAFVGTPALKELFIPSNVVTIENGAFFSALETITIEKPENSISGAPWGATNATVIWTG